MPQNDETGEGSSEFGAKSTTDEVIRGIDLRGKLALVTGASSGLGVETTRALAKAGAQVAMAARDTAKTEQAADSVRKTVPGAQLEVLALDLTRRESIRAFAKQFLADHDALHLLINNAGVMACPLARTEDGWEMQFGTNHLGHFLLTNLLQEALLRGAPARIVNLSSGGHRLGGVDFDDPHFERRDYDKWLAYGQSKTANVLFSVALDARLAKHGVRAYAVHPGGIMTELGRHLEQQDIADLMERSGTEGGLTFKSLEAGAATSVWAATSPSLEGRGGIYLEDCHVARPEGGDGGIGYEAWAVDPEAAERLWQLSEAEVEQRFPAP